MNTLEWFTYLEYLNGRKEVAKRFASGEWKIDFDENTRER